MLSLRARAHLEIDVRFRNAELLEKAALHDLVVVLAGVDQAIAQNAAARLNRLQRIDDRCNFHEVGASAGDEVNTFHFFVFPVSNTAGSSLAGDSQFSIATPGYLAKSFSLLVTTVTLSDTA